MVDGVVVAGRDRCRVVAHVLEVVYPHVAVEDVLATTSDRLGKGHVHKLGLEFQVEDFGGQVLATGVVQGNRAVLTASDEKITCRRVCNSADRLTELGEVVANAGLLDIEDSHGARLETAREDGQGWVRCNAQWLIDRA